MEDSAYNSLMLGVYVFIFITAISLTIFLFSSTVSFADKAYEYGKITTGDSIIETSSSPVYNTVTGAELLTYYYNYKSPDKYGTATAVKYDFKDIDDIQINKLYTLVYESANTGLNPVIKVVEVASEQSSDLGTPIVVNQMPTNPVITTFPAVSLKALPNSRIELKAESTVTYSVLTNYIKSYFWRIHYSTEDGRPDFTTTTIGTVSQLKNIDFGTNIEFRSGINTISVTAKDMLGKDSNTISKTIEVGYNNPVINSLKESSNKVQDNGIVSIESPTGIAFQFVVNATSMNTGAYVQRFDWYQNDVLIQSGASSTLNKNFVPGVYTLRVEVFDSIQGTDSKTFTFSVLPIPAPTIACSNTAVTTAHTIAITTSTVNLTFNASLEAKYGIIKYEWNVDGTLYETLGADVLNLNYGIGAHAISVYGINSEGIISDTKSLNFTITEDFVAFEKVYTSNDIVTLPAGKYIFETWGAQGGNGAGAYGGYSTGQLNLTASTAFQIYVGNSAGYNGGGNSRLSYSNGGGASDIRIADTTSTYKTYYNITFANGGLRDDPNAQHFHGPYEKLKKGTYQLDIYGSNLDYLGEVWACTDIGATRFQMINLVRTNTHISYYVVVPNDDDLMELNVLQYNPATKSSIGITNVTASRLDDRIIVAGGGGGNGGSSIACGGGTSGGLTGSTGLRNCGAPGTGGTQSSGGTTPRPGSYGGTNGSFGIGGNGETIQPGPQGSSGGTSGSTAGAGGGGYYGGGGASCDYPAWNDLDDSGGGGGSSFISGYSGCNAVNISGVHTGQANHYSGLVFINSTMTPGNNSGDGKVKITHIR